MALTLEAEQRLKKVGLLELFEKDRDEWQELAQRSHDFVRGNFPVESEVRRDDVAKHLRPLLEVHEGLGSFLDENKLKQKYWVTDFGDLILELVWLNIHNTSSTPTNA